MKIKDKILKFFYKKKFKNRNIISKIINKNILITGSNTGIGYELTKLLLKKNRIFAIYNKSCENLNKIKNDNLFIINCDLAQSEEINKLDDIFKKNNINIIFFNACYPGLSQNLENIDFKDFDKAIQISFYSSLKIVNSILKNSNKNDLEKIITLSSETGSISNNLTGGRYIYRSIKLLSNFLTKNLSIDLLKNKTISVSIHPGQVLTKMNPNGMIDPETAACRILEFLNLGLDINGKFFNMENFKEIKW